MASFSINTVRNVVPNWRDYKTTAKLGELGGNNATALTIPVFPINDYVDAWKENQSIPFAGDLISAAIMGDQKDNPFVVSAANFLLERRDEIPESLFRTALSIIPNKKLSEEKNTASTSKRLDIILNQEHIYKEKIGFLRKLIHRYPYNPIWYNEIALTYTKLGLINKAVEYMNIAIHLAPMSRYISRSAARLFLHAGEPDRAHDVLVKNPIISKDPWIVASEIGVNALRGRSSRFIKSGISMINSGNYSPFSLTELSSAIGSIEFYHSRKKCKTYIDKALVRPNDNSLSQAEWLLSLDNSMNFTFSDYSLLNNKYEADARRAFLNDDFSQALTTSVEWIEEMPFAKTPIDFAANMAFTFQKKYDDAIKILKIGLKSNPHELSFWNNLAYSFAISGNTEEADKILYGQLLNSPNMRYDIRVCVTATKGLCEFRKGNIDGGRYYYMQAIMLAKEKSEKKLLHKAILNYLREELLATKQCEEEYINALDILNTGNDKESAILRQDIRELLIKGKES